MAVYEDLKDSKNLVSGKFITEYFNIVEKQNIKNDLQIEKEKSDYFYNKSKSKGKWSHLKSEIEKISETGITKIDSIKQLIEKDEDKMIIKELKKNGNDKNKLIKNIKRSLYR